MSYQRLKLVQPLTDQELYDRIRRSVLNKQDLQVLESFLIFNKHVLKTNFYQPTKVALSFRLQPDFLPEVEYPKKPFGMFIVIGNEFRGFHLRFRDVARGGIRIVMSRNKEYCVSAFFVINLELMTRSGIIPSIRGCYLMKTITLRLHSLSRTRIFPKEGPRVPYYLRLGLLPGSASRNMLMCVNHRHHSDLTLFSA